MIWNVQSSLTIWLSWFPLLIKDWGNRYDDLLIHWFVVLSWINEKKKNEVALLINITLLKTKSLLLVFESYNWKLLLFHHYWLYHHTTPILILKCSHFRFLQDDSMNVMVYSAFSESVKWVLFQRQKFPRIFTTLYIIIETA